MKIALGRCCCEPVTPPDHAAQFFPTFAVDYTRTWAYGTEVAEGVTPPPTLADFPGYQAVAPIELADGEFRYLSQGAYSAPGDGDNWLLPWFDYREMFMDAFFAGRAYLRIDHDEPIVMRAGILPSPYSRITVQFTGAYNPADTWGPYPTQQHLTNYRLYTLNSVIDFLTVNVGDPIFEATDFSPSFIAVNAAGEDWATNPLHTYDVTALADYYRSLPGYVAGTHEFPVLMVADPLGPPTHFEKSDAADPLPNVPYREVDNFNFRFDP